MKDFQKFNPTPEYDLMPKYFAKFSLENLLIKYRDMSELIMNCDNKSTFSSRKLTQGKYILRFILSLFNGEGCMQVTGCFWQNTK